MLTITRLVRRFVPRSATPRRPAGPVDTLSLRDWADLPAHHPLVDDASF